jgi:uncharacterized membrane protein
MDLCKYKDIFGKPNTGPHKYRFFGVAIIDVILTIIGGYLIAIFFKLPILYTIIVLFILGIILHRLFCVRTTIDKLLFPN